MNTRPLPTLALGACIALASVHEAALAQITAPASPAPAASPASSPAPSATPAPKPLLIDGYFDGGFTAETSSSAPNALTFTNGVSARVFDNTNAAAVLQNFDLRITDSQPLGGRVEVSLGNDANVMAPFGRWFGNGADLTQAYLQYTRGKFTLDGGKFVTLAGAEVIRSVDDVNYSRSILFGYAIPFTHTGFRLTYAPSSNLSVIGGVNNGWDQLKDTNTAKTAEGAILYTPPGPLSLTVDGYTGKEQISGSASPVSPVSGNRTLLDAIAVFKATGSTTLTANYDVGTQANTPLVDGTGAVVGAGTAKWNGIAGYLTQQITPNLSGTYRMEAFNDVNGYRTGFAQRWNEETVTVAYHPASAPWTLRGEIRTDGSNQPVFTSVSGAGRRNLQTVGVEGLVRF